MSSAAEIVEMFRKDKAARKELVELPVAEPDLRLIIVEAALREVATKQDLKELEERLKNELDYKISALRSELKADIVGLLRELDKLYKIMMTTLIGIMITLATTIITKIIP